VRQRLLIAVLLTLAAGAMTGGVELDLDPRAIAEAIDVGQSRLDAVRGRFHEPYRVSIGRAPVDYLEVVTPFRRVVLAAQTRARAGDRTFGQRDAIAILRETPRQVDLLVELTFHPFNRYVGVPPYEVRLLAASTGTTPEVAPTAIERVPRFGPRMDMPLTFPYAGGPPASPGEPPSGGMLIAHLDGELLGRPAGVYDVFVIEAGKELARMRVDFRNLR
jgi:hypothetical protein